MGLIKGYSCDWLLINTVDYSKPGVIKNLLVNIDGLIKATVMGDSTSASIYLDIKTALERKDVLTFRQKKFMKLWLDGYSMTEIAAMHHIAPKNVHARINAGIRNISKFLCAGG